MNVSIIGGLKDTLNENAEIIFVKLGNSLILFSFNSFLIFWTLSYSARSSNWLAKLLL